MAPCHCRGRRRAARPRADRQPRRPGSRVRRPALPRRRRARPLGAAARGPRGRRRRGRGRAGPGRAGRPRRVVAAAPGGAPRPLECRTGAGGVRACGGRGCPPAVGAGGQRRGRGPRTSRSAGRPRGSARTVPGRPSRPSSSTPLPRIRPCRPRPTRCWRSPTTSTRCRWRTSRLRATRWSRSTRPTRRWPPGSRGCASRPSRRGWSTCSCAATPTRSTRCSPSVRRCATRRTTSTPTQLREFTKQRRQLTASVTTAARRMAREEGVKTTESVADQVEATLTAAMLETDAAKAVRSGLLVTALAATGLGDLDLSGAVALPDALGFSATAATRRRTRPDRASPAARRTRPGCRREGAGGGRRAALRRQGRPRRDREGAPGRAPLGGEAPGQDPADPVRDRRAPQPGRRLSRAPSRRSTTSWARPKRSQAEARGGRRRGAVEVDAARAARDRL